MITMCGRRGERSPLGGVLGGSDCRPRPQPVIDRRGGPQPTITGGTDRDRAARHPCRTRVGSSGADPPACRTSPGMTTWRSNGPHLGWVPVTDDLVRQWADEAEAGYD